MNLVVARDVWKPGPQPLVSNNKTIAAIFFKIKALLLYFMDPTTIFCKRC